MPRDFDVSPYFEIVKPTLAGGFDHHRLAWADMPAGEVAIERVTPPVPVALAKEMDPP